MSGLHCVDLLVSAVAHGVKWLLFSFCVKCFAGSSRQQAPEGCSAETTGGCRETEGNSEPGNGRSCCTSQSRWYMLCIPPMSKWSFNSVLLGLTAGEQRGETWGYLLKEATWLLNLSMKAFQKVQFWSWDCSKLLFLFPSRAGLQMK